MCRGGKVGAPFGGQQCAPYADNGLLRGDEVAWNAS